MDTLGLALESFGPIGAWRKTNDHAAEQANVFPDGETLNGLKDVRAYLLRHQTEFVRGLSERLLAYALDRKLTERDRALLRDNPLRVAADQFRFSRVLLEVAQSEPFRAGWRGADR